MVDKMYSKRLAFNYLEDLAQEFHANYGRRVNSVTRPYAFIEFDVYIQKAKKQLTDRRRNISSINTQLQDVQRIMVQNIDDVLQRGTVLAGNCQISYAFSTHSTTILTRTEIFKQPRTKHRSLIMNFFPFQNSIRRPRTCLWCRKSTRRTPNCSTASPCTWRRQPLASYS